MESTKTEIENNQVLADDENLKNELLEVFMLEFGELMVTYQDALKEIHNPKGENKHAYSEIFRVFHTLKGDSSYFGEFDNFVKYSSAQCDNYRNIPEEKMLDPELYNIAKLNYYRLSTPFNTLNRGQSLKIFRFKLFLRNY